MSALLLQVVGGWGVGSCPTDTIHILLVGLQGTFLQLCVSPRAPHVLALASVVCYPRPHHLSLVCLSQVYSHQLAWFTYHTYCFPKIRHDAHRVEEVGEHIKFPLEPICPRRFQYTIVCIEKGRCLPGRLHKPIQSPFLPSYFIHPGV